MKTQSITILLNKLGQGQKHLLDDIYSVLYKEIKAIATNQINGLKVGQTITPTVIANECYLKLAKKNNLSFTIGPPTDKEYTSFVNGSPSSR